MNSIELKAPAKINLGLDVLRRRPDGYHEVKMVMQTIDLCDDVRITLREDEKICLNTNLDFLPTDERNIAYKAAVMLKDYCGICQGVDISLEKHIPVAAGMAGGSTNAAAVLEGMNCLFSLELSREKLMELGLKLGADVPYCLMQGTALSEGIGEVLTPLMPLPDCQILIAKPAVSVSTKWVYENLHVDKITDHPDVDAVAAGLLAQDLYSVCENMENILERVTAQEYPVIVQIKETMKQLGALNALMSGSGPTVFGIFDDDALARNAYDVLKQKEMAKQVFLVKPVNRR